ncbi:(Fe-S)-binding protein [Endothiovibrio diazotrophicus]
MNPSELIREADRCVLCGLCLPVCPTYRLLGDEGDSPRGRISLMRALAEGRLKADAALAGRLDRCLGCRACEAMCPSKVRYGRIVDGGRALLGARGGARLRRVLANPRRRIRYLRLAHLYERSGLRRVLRASGLLRRFGLERMERLAPPFTAPSALPAGFAPAGVPRGRVALFAGCLAEGVDHPAVVAAGRLLAALGYRVELPPGQGCCGAMDAHAGDTRNARRLAAANSAGFPDGVPLLSLNSGCGAHLAEYGEWAGAAGEALAARHRDCLAFLAEAAWPDGLLRPVVGVVLVHEPCSLRNVLKGADALYRLLARLPGAEVRPLPGNERCCGAAGDYLLRQPTIADALREEKLDALAALAPRYLVSSNRGCLLHLAAGLRERGIEVEVLHPLELLARQLV